MCACGDTVRCVRVCVHFSLLILDFVHVCVATIVCGDVETKACLGYHRESQLLDVM